MGRRLIDLTGQKFGRLIVKGKERKNGRTMWLCECECGNKTIVQGSALTGGITQSCGCLRSEATSKRRTKHGMSKTKLYTVWAHMIQRCENPNSRDYQEYGGRGITVCNEWRNSFEVFRDWAITSGYNDTLTLDRISVNGNYDPLNCRWATQKEQQNNRRNNHIVEYNGEKHTLSEWSEIIKINQDVLFARLKLGWSIEKTLTTPARKLKTNPRS